MNLKTLVLLATQGKGTTDCWPLNRGLKVSGEGWLHPIRPADALHKFENMQKIEED